MTANLGESFEGGCGFDPLFGQLDSWGHAATGGCCLLNDLGTWNCRACECDSGAGVDDCASVLLREADSRGNYFNFTCDLYEAAVRNLSLASPDHDDARLDLTIINRGLAGTSAAACAALGPYCRVYACDVDAAGRPESATCAIPSTFFIDDDGDGAVKLRLCGPTEYQMTFDDEIVYRPSAVDYSRPGNRRARTSGSFLCSLPEW